MGNGFQRISDTPRNIETGIFVVAALLFAGGFIGALLAWPEYAQGLLDYALAVYILFSCIISGLLFMAIGKVLEYLRAITFLIANEDQRTEVFGSSNSKDFQTLGSDAGASEADSLAKKGSASVMSKEQAAEIRRKQMGKIL